MVCAGSDDGGLSQKLYKACIANKSIKNFTIPKPSDLFYFVDEIKIKFTATKVLLGRFPNGTIFIETVLEVDGLSMNDWYAIDNANKLL